MITWGSTKDTAQAFSRPSKPGGKYPCWVHGTSVCKDAIKVQYNFVA